MTCCLRNAHRVCLNRAVMAHQECPQCEFLLSVEGVIAMQRAKSKPACSLICTTSVVVIHLTHRNLLTLSPHHNHSGQCTFRNKYNFQKVIRKCVRPLPEMNGHGLMPTFHLYPTIGLNSVINSLYFL